MQHFTLIDELPGASDALRALARQGVPRTYAKGRLLIEEDELGDTLYIILTGRLRAFASADNGREITYGHYGPGEYVGEMSLDGGPRSASVEATERCVCAVITRRTLEAFIAEHPAFAFELLAKVIRRARAATLTARQMALNDVYGRLRGVLDELAEPFEGDLRIIRERITHQDLAHRIGCSREMVSRIIKDLERGGHVRIEDRRIVIVRDPPPRW
jgi:CRP/FNR family cyclic AMP-dependent transcriptional regulator